MVNVSNNMFLIIDKLNDIARVTSELPLPGVGGDEETME